MGGGAGGQGRRGAGVRSLVFNLQSPISNLQSVRRKSQRRKVNRRRRLFDARVKRDKMKRIIIMVLYLIFVMSPIQTFWWH